MARYPVRKAVAPRLVSHEDAPLLVEEEVAVKRLVRSEASALERVAISHPVRIQRIATADRHDTSERRGSTRMGVVPLGSMGQAGMSQKVMRSVPAPILTCAIEVEDSRWLR